MLVAQVTPYPPTRNGIGDYTGDLCRALQACDPPVDTIVLADQADGAPREEPGVRRCWNPREDWAQQVTHAIDELSPDVVHIQHGFHFGFGKPMMDLLQAIRQRDKGCIVTLHGVWTSSLLRRGPRRLHRALASLADRIIIHQRQGGVDRLVADGVTEPSIAIVPHGTAETPKISRAEARAKLGLSDKDRIAVFLGLVYWRKGLHTLLPAFARAAQQVAGAKLVVAGRLRRDYPGDGLYLSRIERHVRQGQKKGWIDWRPDHVPEELLTPYMVAADAVVFPYNRPQGSSSGVFHRALAAGRAVICSNCPTFGEAIDRWGKELPETIAEPGSVDSWTRALVAVLGDDSLCQRAAAAATRLGQETSWLEVAQQHIEIYQQASRP